jgi:hypothetical protein
VAVCGLDRLDHPDLRLDHPDLRLDHPDLRLDHPYDRSTTRT